MPLASVTKFIWQDRMTVEDLELATCISPMLPPVVCELVLTSEPRSQVYITRPCDSRCWLLGGPQAIMLSSTNVPSSLVRELSQLILACASWHAGEPLNAPEVTVQQPGARISSATIGASHFIACSIRTASMGGKPPDKSIEQRQIGAALPCSQRDFWPSW